MKHKALMPSHLTPCGTGVRRGRKPGKHLGNDLTCHHCPGFYFFHTLIPFVTF
uniref:Uncharacterized protein n=1 Tax=Anguilla anguilla TaxID=7936 RepID=A0A0E9WZU2_ANGAN